MIDSGDSHVRWTKIDSWHLIGDTKLTPNGTWMVTTRCGIERAWDQTFLDRLPGGGESSCENCLLLLAGDTAPQETKPKRSRKKE